MSKASEIAASMFSIGEELNKEASEFEKSLSKEIVEKESFKMSDYIKPQQVNEEVIKKEASSNNDKTPVQEEGEKALKRGVGGVAVGGGAKILGDTIKSGEVDGVKKMTHVTGEKNIPNILKEGLKGTDINKESLATKGLVPQIVTGHIKKEDLAGKTYLANNKKTEEEIKLGRKLNGINEKSSKVKVNMPLSDLKNVKTDNPEMMGAKNEKEYIEKYRKMQSDFKSKGGIFLNDMQDAQLKNTYGTLGDKGTTTIQGDVATKHIKGSKDYQKNNLKAVGKHIKNNPKMFAKGLGKSLGGAALVGAGGKLVYDGMKKDKTDKVAFTILEEAGLIKLASEKDAQIDKIAFTILEEAGLTKLASDRDNKRS